MSDSTYGPAAVGISGSPSSSSKSRMLVEYALTRLAALGAVTALLIGLVGSVIGGWMASGEPMSLTSYRTRPATMHQSAHPTA